MLNWCVLSLSILVCWFPPKNAVQFDQSPLSACDLEVDAGPDTNVCAPGGAVQLMGSITGNDVFFEWTPHNGLSNPFILNPIANVNGPITYTLTAYAPDPNNPNLVVNGDFSAGNTGFVSDYNYVADIPGNQSEMVPEGTYTVINNPNLVHTGFNACGDHTTGSGNMMVINGAANFQDIWCQTVTVTEDSYYNVSAWVASVNSASPAELQFSINGVPIGPIVNAVSTPCVWTPFNAIWNSGSSTSAEICILNLNTALGGNDFALDDISIIGLCSVSDEVVITIYEEEAPEPIIDGPDFVCEGDVVIYTASFPPEPPIYEYIWSVNGAGVILNGQGTPEITVQWNDPDEAQVCLDIETRCEMNDACYDVTVGTLPELPFINGATDLCPGESSTFYTPEQDPDDQYDWTLPSNVTLISGQGTNEIDIEWASPGEAEICVAITNACGTTDNCTLITLHENYFVLFDTLICQGTTFELNGTTYGNGVLTGTEFFLTVHGCDSVVEVEVMEASILIYQVNTSMCPGDSIFLDGAYQAMSGVYIDSFVTASGCDSIIETTLLVAAVDTTLLFSNTCDSMVAGTIVTIYSLGSCDSVVIETITFIPADTVYYFGSSCLPADTGYTALHLTNVFGCDSIIVTDIDLLPTDTTLLFDNSCDPADVGTVMMLLSNRFGCDSLVIETTSFLLSDTTYLELIACVESDTGTVQNLFTNADGCDSLVITHTGYGGSDTTFLLFMSCSASDSGWTVQALINVFGCDSVVASYTAFLASDTTYIDARSCNPIDTGFVTLQLLNQAGCDSTVFIHTALIDLDSCALEATYTITPPLCFGDPGMLEITIATGLPDFILEFSQADLVEGFTINAKGQFQFEIPFYNEFVFRLSSANGITIEDTLDLSAPDPIDFGLSTSADFNGLQLDCYGIYDATIYPVMFDLGTPPLTYTWSHGAVTDTIYNLGPGSYILTVTDANGCTSTRSVTLTEPPPMEYELIVDLIDCFGEQNGSISITAATGGVMPWTTSLNGISSGNQLNFQNLSAGTYQLVITDQHDCTFTESLMITEPDAWQISLGPDTTINYGEELTLSPSFTGSPQGNLQIEWSDGACVNCLSRTFQPGIFSVIGVTVTDEAGCVSTDEIHIQVVIDRDLFVPNIFSPNNDQINDLVLISASPSLREIVWFRIYDRWGNLVFAKQHFAANDPQFAWDGTMNGDLLNPAVFTYQLQAQYSDGHQEVRFGDITLMR